MNKIEETPWVSYLEIDENTLESKLKDDTTEKIRKKYNEHINNKLKEKPSNNNNIETNQNNFINREEIIEKIKYHLKENLCKKC